jgi:hypothetical protein
VNAEFLRVLGEALVAAAATLTVERAAPAKGEDRWLTPAEAAERLAVSQRWISRRWRRLLFCHQLPEGRGFRVSERELERYMARRG